MCIDKSPSKIVSEINSALFFQQKSAAHMAMYLSPDDIPVLQRSVWRRRIHALYTLFYDDPTTTLGSTTLASPLSEAASAPSSIIDTIDQRRNDGVDAMLDRCGGGTQQYILLWRALEEQSGIQLPAFPGTATSPSDPRFDTIIANECIREANRLLQDTTDTDYEGIEVILSSSCGGGEKEDDRGREMASLFSRTRSADRLPPTLLLRTLYKRKLKAYYTLVDDDGGTNSKQRGGEDVDRCVAFFLQEAYRDEEGVIAQEAKAEEARYLQQFVGFAPESATAAMTMMDPFAVAEKMRRGREESAAHRNFTIERLGLERMWRSVQDAHRFYVPAVDVSSAALRREGQRLHSKAQRARQEGGGSVERRRQQEAVLSSLSPNARAPLSGAVGSLPTDGSAAHLPIPKSLVHIHESINRLAEASSLSPLHQRARLQHYPQPLFHEHDHQGGETVVVRGGGSSQRDASQDGWGGSVNALTTPPTARYGETTSRGTLAALHLERTFGGMHMGNTMRNEKAGGVREEKGVLGEHRDRGHWLLEMDDVPTETLVAEAYYRKRREGAALLPRHGPSPAAFVGTAAVPTRAASEPSPASTASPPSSSSQTVHTVTLVIGGVTFHQYRLLTPLQRCLVNECILIDLSLIMMPPSSQRMSRGGRQRGVGEGGRESKVLAEEGKVESVTAVIGGGGEAALNANGRRDEEGLGETRRQESLTEWKGQRSRSRGSRKKEKTPALGSSNAEAEVFDARAAQEENRARYEEAEEAKKASATGRLEAVDDDGNNRTDSQHVAPAQPHPPLTFSYAGGAYSHINTMTVPIDATITDVALHYPSQGLQVTVRLHAPPSPTPSSTHGTDYGHLLATVYIPRLMRAVGDAMATTPTRGVVGGGGGEINRPTVGGLVLRHTEEACYQRGMLLRSSGAGIHHSQPRILDVAVSATTRLK